MILRVLAPVLVALLSPALARAAETAPDTSTSVWFDPVIVTATRGEQNRKDVPVNVTVVSERAIRESASQTVADLLREVAGFSLLRYGSSVVGTPQLQSVSLRGIGGTSSSRTLVLVDGVPLNDPFGSWVYWSRVPKESVERIEIVRGGGATTWGSLAMGGVINIITKRPHDRTVSLLAQGGSHATSEVNLFAGDALGPVLLSIAVDDFDTDGFFEGRAEQRGTIHRPSWSDHTSVETRADIAPSQGSRLYLRGGYFEEDRLRGSPYPKSDTINRSFGGGGEFVTGDGSVWRADAYYQDQDFFNTSSTIAADGSSETPSLDQVVPVRGAGVGAGWRKPVAGVHELSAGADYQKIEGETVESSRYVGGRFTRGRSAGGKQALSGVYAQEVYSPTPRWRATAAVRADRVRTWDGFLLESNLENGNTTRDETFEDETETIVSPSLGLLHHLSERTALRGAAYLGFRAANLNELYRPIRASGDVVTAANPALAAERLKGVELGVDHNVRSSVVARATGFWSEVEDPIIYVTIEEVGDTARNVPPCGFLAAGGVCRQRENLGLLRTRGSELEIEARPSSLWTVTGSWVYTDCSVLSAPGRPELVGKRTRQVPLNQFVMKLSYRNPAIIQASLVGRYAGNRYEDDLNTLATGDFFVMDLQLARRISNRSDLYLGVENLLDKDYVLAVDQTGQVDVGPPFLMHLGVRLRLL